MKLLFEESRPGRGCKCLPKLETPLYQLSPELLRAEKPALPEMAEVDIVRHYSQLERRTYGVNNGFYPLGSCTMKYNPHINEAAAQLPGFSKIHPLQPAHTVQGALETLNLAEEYLCEITGMDRMTFQSAAGAHGEYTGLLLIRAYHKAKGDGMRTKIIIPDSAHGTNPASAAMAGFDVVNIPSMENGCVDLKALQEACDSHTAGLMLTNPNTVGLFDENILEITRMVHEAGGLNYYDGANLNAIMGVARPGDMGFDVVHLNLHKTFSTPHGGGGPGSGPVGCKKLLAPFLPYPVIRKQEGSYAWEENLPQSIGKVKAFYGHFLVVVRALTYILALGREGVRESAQNAVLNANYLMHGISSKYPIAFSKGAMHEFVITLEQLKKETGVSALDVAKALAENGIHPPTMYFPLIVEEALMAEPTETESKDTLDQVIEQFLQIYELAEREPGSMHEMPLTTPVRRLDEVAAARNPKLRYIASKQE